ncbi:Lrp/AsnC ligand binding domain-containing protein [Stutzerimonas nitrititolerans]|uniref:Lrp/AsnC ligand binding domain-containing protein n=2 Tax=Stutzerimonas nitrititolerans TaxID=2482751 RepID=UPI0028A976BA|nr:Lrp/AsnC ligand binding domain-containing protein [Stutzerimonas nitrititolerans]
MPQRMLSTTRSVTVIGHRDSGVRSRFSRRRRWNRFIESVQELPEVLECHLMAGDCDFLLRVVAADLNAYRQFQARLARIKGVQSLKSDVPMQQVKLTSELPV